MNDKTSLNERVQNLFNLNPRSESVKRLWIEGGLIISFWLIIFIFTIGQRAIDQSGLGGASSEQVWQAAREFGLWALLTPGIFWLSHRFGFDSPSWPKHLLLHICLCLGISALMDPISRPISHNPVSWEILFSLVDELIIYVTILATGFARVFSLRYRSRKYESERLRAQLAEAQLKALRMQMNPHFLFNTLHAVSTLVDIDPSGVRNIIVRLSDMLRHTLDGTDEQEVTLDKELQFLESYLEIEIIRFQGMLDVSKEVDPDLLDALIPNLVLQPLVENAIQHGMNDFTTTYRVKVRVYHEDGFVFLVVSDNGTQFSGDMIPQFNYGVGLHNIDSRLQQLYGDKQKLSFRTTAEGGIVAQIKVPYQIAADREHRSIDHDVAEHRETPWV